MFRDLLEADHVRRWWINASLQECRSGPLPFSFNHVIHFQSNHAALWGTILIVFSNVGLAFPLKTLPESGCCRCIPVSGTAGGSARRGEEGLQMQGNERSGEINSARGCIVINVYGKKEGRRPEGIDSGVRWGSGSNKPLHSPEELKKHIRNQAEQLKAKGGAEPFLYLRGDREVLFTDSREVIQAAAECGVKRVCFSGHPERPQGGTASSMPSAFIFLLPHALLYGNGNGLFYPLVEGEGSLEVLVKWLKNKKRDAGSAGGRAAVRLMVAGDVPNQRAVAVMNALTRAGMDSVVLKTLKDS